MSFSDEKCSVQFQLIIFQFLICSCTKIADAYSCAAVIACSSGSTGLSKSICISHAVLIHSFCAENSQPPFVSLSFSSLYWFSGIWSALAPAFKGTRVFTANTFSTDTFFDLVENHKVIIVLSPNN